MLQRKLVLEKNSRDCLIYWLVKYPGLRSLNIGGPFWSVLRDRSSDLQFLLVLVLRQKKKESLVKLPLPLPFDFIIISAFASEISFYLRIFSIKVSNKSGILKS